MPWIAASLVSAVFLGVYQLFTKHAVRGNAVLPVLFLSNVCGAAVWLALQGVQAARPGLLPPALVTDPLTRHDHVLLILKSALVSASWLCSYFAVKHLPVSIAAPIRATGPVWTLFGALLLLGERPGGLEFAGMATTLVSFFGLSMAGGAEGIHFHRDKWIGWLMLGTILGALSALYDKYLLGAAGYSTATVQCWFAIYLAVLFLPVALGWWIRDGRGFQWRWSIPLLAFALLIADFVYFSALRNPDALVSIVSSLRRGSTLVAFAGGLLFFGEKNGWKKLPAVLGVITGIVLTILG